METNWPATALKTLPTFTAISQSFWKHQEASLIATGL